MKKKRKLAKRLILLIMIIGIFDIANIGFKSGDSGLSYRTVQVTRGDISQVVNATGTLKPIREVTVGTQASGQISKLYVQVNDEVKSGQLLAEIDPALMAAQLKQSTANEETARINFEQAARDLKRTRDLLAKDYVAKVDLEHAEQAYQSAQNGYDSSKSQVEHDKVNLDYTKIFSPIDGVITSQDATLGETLASNFQTPSMFKIAQELSMMNIEVNFSESDIGKVKAGMPVTFSVDAYPDQTFRGSIKTINLDANSQQQGMTTYTAMVSVDNKDKLLRPGMTAYVNVILAEQKNVLRVPAAALRFVPPQKETGGLQRMLSNAGISVQPASVNAEVNAPDDAGGVYVLRDGKAVPVAVTPGVTDNMQVEVSAGGLHEGDLVITGILHKKKQ